MDAEARTSRLLEARRLGAARKRRHTLKTIDAVVARGDHVTFAAVAREAAGLRSDILLAREEIRELRRERDHLRDRLRQILGAELDHAPRSELVERITELERRTQDLAAEHTEAVTLASRFEAELAAAASDLAAARAANRRLMREANAPRPSG